MLLAPLFYLRVMQMSICVGAPWIENNPEFPQHDLNIKKYT
jgi:hypothetical protein